MTQKKESIWTRDITPHVVSFFTADITPDFSSELWTKDITHHVIGSLAVFGLVVSSFVAVAGVTAVGVNVEVAFAQQTAASQTAALAMGDNQPASAVLLPSAPVPPDSDHHMGSTTMDHPMPAGAVGSSTAMFCPKIARTIGRGSHEATTTGDVGQLQQFIANHFGLNRDDVVTGHFGSTTQAFLEKFQQEQGIPKAPFAGPLTRAAIARLCNPSSHDPMTTKGDVMRDNHMGSSTMMGSTTPPMPPRHDDTHPPMPPKAPTTTPVSYIIDNPNGSNAASVVEAVNEISDGYSRLIGGVLGLVGLN